MKLIGFECGIEEKSNKLHLNTKKISLIQLQGKVVKEQHWNK